MGYTLMHEHLYIDLSKVKKDDDCCLDAKEEMIEEFKELYSNGVRRIVDVTNIGIGRNLPYISEIERATGIEIIKATGFYKDPFLPDNFDKWTIDEISQIMIREIQEGIDGDTSNRAQIIGEVGTSHNKVTPNEKKLLKAAAKAGKETGVPITTHTTLGTMGMEQIALLKACGVTSEKIIIGHVDLSGDIAYIERLLREGVYVAFDTIGKENYLSDDKRIEMLIKLMEKGYGSKLLLSLDITRKSNMSYLGGIGYNYLFNNFIPKLLKAGAPKKAIKMLLEDNPKRIF